jgi:hypothetical protein
VFDGSNSDCDRDQHDGCRTERCDWECNARSPPSAPAALGGSGTHDPPGLDRIVNSCEGRDHARTARALGKVTLPQDAIAAAKRSIVIGGDYRRVRALRTAAIAFGGKTANDDSIEQARPIVF